MAAAAATTPAIDMSAPSSFNIRLGATLSKQTNEQRYRNVRYNYKPHAAQAATVTSNILPGKQPNASTLSLKDGDKEWKYSGQHKEDEDMYVLVLSGDGKKEVVLERLGSSHAVNLTQTPEDDDEDSLARKHPHLTDNESDNDDDDIFGREVNAEDALPNASNPFDFRHFLKAVEEESKRKEATPQPTRSSLGTPMHSAVTSAPVARPTKTIPAKPTTASAAPKKRKTPSAAATRPNPKRVKAGEDPPATKTSTSTAPAKAAAADSEVPKLRLDRKASIHHTKEPKPHTHEPDYEDDGELILENSTDQDPRQNPTHLSAMSLALQGALSNRGSGPISLRSAASSPGVNSPQPDSSAAQGKQEGEEFDFGGGSSPAGEQYEFEFVDDDDDNDDDGDDDNNNDDGDGDGDEDDNNDDAGNQPDQPRQQTTTTSSRSRRGSLAGPVVGTDEEDDMEAQLALAMAAEEDEEEVPVATYEESDEDVSEEE